MSEQYLGCRQTPSQVDNSERPAMASLFVNDDCYECLRGIPSSSDHPNSHYRCGKLNCVCCILHANPITIGLASITNSHPLPPRTPFAKSTPHAMLDDGARRGREDEGFMRSGGVDVLSWHPNRTCTNPIQSQTIRTGPNPKQFECGASL